MSWRQWFSLLLLYIIYLLFGGFVFLLIESPAEDVRVDESRNLKHAIYDSLIRCDGNGTNQNLSEREEVWIQIAEQINQPSLIHNSSDVPKKWTFYNSFFVAVTVASTIGYGHLAPSSAFGRIFCIAFALIGIPLNGILFSSVGDSFHKKYLRKSRKRAAAYSAFFALVADVTLFFIPGLFVFLAIPAGVFTVVEGWNFLDSFYYAFVTLTTIGFGDLVAGQSDIGPWSWVYRCFIILWIVFGLGYLVMVINIITKGFRSKPIVSINKKMSARIRATRKTLAKDAIALRELVNQIRIAKAKTKPTHKPDQTGECRQSTLHDGDEPNSHVSTECKSRLTRFHSDHSIYCINKETAFNLSTPCCKKKELDEDPVQLLTRLVAVLCDENENEEDDEELPEIDETDQQSTTEHNKNILPVPETIMQRIHRSLRFSGRAPGIRPVFSTQLSSSTPSSPKMGVGFGSVGRRFAIKNCIRLNSESKNLEYNPTFRSQQQLALENEAGKLNARLSNRSFSESNSLNQTISSDTFPLDVAKLKEETMVGENCSCTFTNQTAVPIPAIVEFCDILDRVGPIQVSRRNSTEST